MFAIDNVSVFDCGSIRLCFGSIHSTQSSCPNSHSFGLCHGWYSPVGLCYFLYILRIGLCSRERRVILRQVYQRNHVDRLRHSRVSHHYWRNILLSAPTGENPEGSCMRQFKRPKSQPPKEKTNSHTPTPPHRDSLEINFYTTTFQVTYLANPTWNTRSSSGSNR